jgi:hypothetical protein
MERHSPSYQNEYVTLYVKGGPVGKVVQAVTEPPSMESAERLRALNTSTAADKLQRIAEIIRNDRRPVLGPRAEPSNSY